MMVAWVLLVDGSSLREIQLGLSWVLLCPTVRHYWQSNHQMFFIDGVLFYKWMDLLDPRNLLVVRRVIPIRSKKPSRHHRAEMGQYHAGAPMDHVLMDILGPLSKTIVDAFFSRFGFYMEIHTDQWKNVMSNLFTVLCELLQITKTCTTRYCPCSNGQIERMNRTVLLRDKNFHDWDLYLPHISSGIQSTVNRSSGFTPDKLMLRREVYKPVHVWCRSSKSSFLDTGWICGLSGKDHEGNTWVVMEKSSCKCAL